MFLAAYEGYFDKEEQHNLILRRVAQAAGAGFIKSEDFNRFWPVTRGVKQVDKKVWGDTMEETLALRDAIQRAHNIKLN